MEDFNFYVITFYFIAFEFYIMLNSHSNITKMLFNFLLILLKIL